ncbi:MarR family transcriptional regulator [Burkholderia sp. SJ98]|nr:MarR family transcriptional regulator [Burkholderia sp. SJ98]
MILDAEMDLDFLPEHIVHHYHLLNFDLARLHARLFEGTPIERRNAKLTTLVVASLNPGVTLSVFAKLIGQDSSAMTRIVDDLVSEGLLVRAPSPHGRRAIALDITVEGRAALAEYRRIAKQCEQEFTAPLTAEEKKQALHILRKLRRYHSPCTDAIGQDGT